MSVFDTITGSPNSAAGVFQWTRDASGAIVLPSLPPLPQEFLEDADEVSVSFTSSDTSINDDGSMHTESVEVKATKRKTLNAGVMRPKWETDAKDALKKNLKDIASPLRDLVDRDANEGDTRMIINEILVNGLGYNRYTEITTEFMVRGEFCDYGIVIDGDVKVIVEVKRVGKRLSDRDVKQAEAYALRKGIPWAVLTNGVTWRLYHVTASVPTRLDIVFEVDILDDATKAVEKLFYLTRGSLGRNQVEAVWEYVDATNPESIKNILLSESVIDEVRRALGRTSGIRLTDKEVEKLIFDALH